MDNVKAFFDFFRIYHIGIGDILYATFAAIGISVIYFGLVWSIVEMIKGRK